MENKLSNTKTNKAKYEVPKWVVYMYVLIAVKGTLNQTVHLQEKQNQEVHSQDVAKRVENKFKHLNQIVHLQKKQNQ